MTINILFLVMLIDFINTDIQNKQFDQEINI